jgi:hypothetical protein
VENNGCPPLGILNKPQTDIVREFGEVGANLKNK